MKITKHFSCLIAITFTTSLMIGCSGKETVENTQTEPNVNETAAKVATSQNEDTSSDYVSPLPESAPVFQVAIERDAYPPFEFKDEYGKFKGYDFDLIRMIGEEAGFKVKMNPLPFSDVLASVERGDNDLAISALTVSDERLMKFDASEPYIRSASSFVVKSESGIDDINKLSGMKVAVQDGGFQYKRLEETGKYQLKPMKTNFLAFQSIFTNDANALFADRTMLFFLSEQFSEHPVEFLPFGEQNYLAIFVNKGDSEKLDSINEGLSKVKASGKYQKLNEKWFGKHAVDVTVQ